MRGPLIRSLLTLAIPLALPAFLAGAVQAQGPSSDADPKEEERPVAPAPPAPASPARLFAAVEEAWLSANGEAFATLVDTASVRIALKPGVTPTAAPTRSAAAFLFQDQIRLVTSQSFQIQKLTVAKSSASATALWTGDWGGRTGTREVRVSFTAAPSGGRWLLREVRARD